MPDRCGQVALSLSGIFTIDLFMYAVVRPEISHLFHVQRLDQSSVVSTHGRCHVSLWLTRFSGVGPSCSALSRYGHGGITHTTGRLTSIIVQGICLLKVMGHENLQIARWVN